MLNILASQFSYISISEVFYYLLCALSLPFNKKFVLKQYSHIFIFHLTWLRAVLDYCEYPCKEVNFFMIAAMNGS